MSEQDLLIARMLNGEDFTYGGLCQDRKIALFERGEVSRDGDHDRLIDRTIQKLRRKGLIAFARKNGAVVWTAVQHEARQ